MKILNFQTFSELNESDDDEDVMWKSLLTQGLPDVTTNQSDEEEPSSAARALAEVESYLQKPIEPQSCDSVQYWRERREKFPLLSGKNFYKIII